jgi:hypothetical protein
VIEYRPCEKTRNEITLARLRMMAEERLSPTQNIERYADAIAAAMAKVHGGDFQVRIDHQIGYVLVKC